MDAGHNIYRLDEDEVASLSSIGEGQEVTDDVLRVAMDVARLDGFLAGRVESDRRKHETLVWDSKQQGTYRRSD